MLTTLRINNLALVEDLTIDWSDGFNAITGETGAGKSIILGALNLVLGERADRTLLRAGADHCSVEAVFDIRRLRAPLAPFLEEKGLEPCDAGQLLLKRVSTAGGTNRQFINGSPTALSVLAEVGQWLVDIHGPHDHQSLLQPARQLAILDAFGDLTEAREAFGRLVRQRSILESARRELMVDEHAYSQQLDLLRFQVAEITAARLGADEEQEIEEEHRRASNAARLLELAQAAQTALEGEEDSLFPRSGQLGRTLHDLRRIDPGTGHLVELHDQITALLHDVQSGLSHYLDRIDLDPARLQQLEERLNLIHSLKRKYGASVAEVLRFGEEATARLAAMEGRDEEIARLTGEIEKLTEDLWQAGSRLSDKRRKVIPKLANAVRQQLRDLGFDQSRFGVEIRSVTDRGSLAGTWSCTGLDSIEFQFEPNPGEPARPLRAIASSGELARVMLALKTVLATEDEVPVLIFDEVDANVGGETANAVGAKMRQIAVRRQVFCVTHLAPVAAAASAHFVVTKRLKAGRTISEIERLDRPRRVRELARMLGGEGDAARKHAAALLQPAP